MRRFAFAACLLAASIPAARAGTIENLGTDIAIALPLVAGGITLDKGDWPGTAQAVVDTAATVGIAYGLKHVIRERRPDGSDWQSMPSDTAALAFAPAQFLWDRYGWSYGLPAYAAAGFVAGALAARHGSGSFVLCHSIMWQYLPDATKAAITAHMEQAGATATAAAPVHWLRVEPLLASDAFATLSLTQWPGGETRHLARCDYHGRWIEWFGQP